MVALTLSLIGGSFGGPKSLFFVMLGAPCPCRWPSPARTICSRMTCCHRAELQVPEVLQGTWAHQWPQGPLQPALHTCCSLAMQGLHKAGGLSLTEDSQFFLKTSSCREQNAYSICCTQMRQSMPAWGQASAAGLTWLVAERCSPHTW